MPELGSTYRCNLPPRHIWIIISDPNEHDQKFVFVNLTSLTESCVDDSCILRISDYPPFLTQVTTVAYSRHQIGNLPGMAHLERSGHFFEMPPVPPDTLHMIIEGAWISPELPNAVKLMLPPLRKKGSTSG